MKFDVVIPNYNGFSLLEKNLPILLKVLSKYNCGAVIINDDYSKIEDYELLGSFIEEIKSKYKTQVKLFRNDKNYGFSTTVDNGVRKAESEYVLLLNTDVIASENFIDPIILDFEKNENLYGVGIMDKSIEDGGNVLRGRGLASWKRGFLVHRRGEINSADTFWISGGSCMVKRDLFLKFGGFDPLYNPFYWEDIDLSYRVQKAGYAIMFENRSEVEHRHKEGAIKKHYNSDKINTIAYRNQFIFVWKNISDFNLLLSHALWLPYHMARALARFDKPFFVGLLCAIIRLPQIYKKRVSQKRLYKLKDADIIKNQ